MERLMFRGEACKVTAFLGLGGEYGRCSKDEAADGRMRQIADQLHLPVRPIGSRND